MTLASHRGLLLGLTGLAGGLISTLLGVGGGALMVPAMILLGIPAKTAIGSSLAAIVPISLTGLTIHIGLAAQDLKIVAVLFLLVGSSAGSWLGSRLASRSPDWVLKKALAVLLLAVGLRFVGVYHLLPNGTIQPPGHPLVWLVLLGLIAGILSALFGIGGGVLVVPTLVLAFAYPIHSAVVTSLGLILPTSLIGAVFHYRLGHVNFHTALSLALPALAGAVAGAFLAQSLDASSLKFVFGFFLLAVSARLLLEKGSRIKKVV